MNSNNFIGFFIICLISSNQHSHYIMNVMAQNCKIFYNISDNQFCHLHKIDLYNLNQFVDIFLYYQSMSKKESLYTWMTQKAILTMEKITPTPKKTTFQKTGKLTPEEFVLAGDYLVQNYPAWEWMSGEKSKIRSNLPCSISLSTMYSDTFIMPFPAIANCFSI